MINKMLKNRIAIMLCAALILSVGITAFADENDGTGAYVDDTGTVVNSGSENLPSDTGIIDAGALQTMIDNYASANNITPSNLSVGYCYLATGDTWYYNGDSWHYSASLYKVPVAMLLAEKEAAGELTQESVLQTSYCTRSLGEMESASIIQSDNYTGHGMVEYLGGSYSGKCADQIVKFADLPDSYYDPNFYDVSYYSAKFYTQVLKTLYEGGEAAYPHILEYMKQAIPGSYLKLKLGGQYEIAQKYGAYIENSGQGDNNNHAAGIIYTPNPIVVTVMTVNVGNYEEHIGEIARMLAEYTLTLDSKIEQYYAEQQKAAEEAERARAEEAARQAEEEAALERAKEEQAAAQSAAIAEAAVPMEQEKEKSSFPIVPVIIGMIVVAAAATGVILFKTRRQYSELEEYDEFDEPLDDFNHVKTNGRRGGTRYDPYDFEPKQTYPDERYYKERTLYSQDEYSDDYSDGMRNEMPNNINLSAYSDSYSGEPEMDYSEDERRNYMAAEDYLAREERAAREYYTSGSDYDLYNDYSAEPFEQEPDEGHGRPFGEWRTSKGSDYKPRH